MTDANAHHRRESDCLQSVPAQVRDAITRALGYPAAGFIILIQTENGAHILAPRNADIERTLASALHVVRTLKPTVNRVFGPSQ